MSLQINNHQPNWKKKDGNNSFKLRNLKSSRCATTKVTKNLNCKNHYALIKLHTTKITKYAKLHNSDNYCRITKKKYSLYPTASRANESPKICANILRTLQQ